MTELGTAKAAMAFSSLSLHKSGRAYRKFSEARLFWMGEWLETNGGESTTREGDAFGEVRRR